MNDIKESDLIKKLKGARLMEMTSKDKALIMERLKDRMGLVVPPRVSPFANFLKMPSAFVVASIILVVALGGVVYAAEGTLPGDLLYPVKVNFNEPAISALKVSREAKADWNEKRLERRIRETEELVTENKLDDRAVIILEDKIDTHFKEYEDSAEEDEEVEARIEAHKAVLEKVKIENSGDQEEKIEKIERKLEGKSKKQKSDKSDKERD